MNKSFELIRKLYDIGLAVHGYDVKAFRKSLHLKAEERDLTIPFHKMSAQILAAYPRSFIFAKKFVMYQTFVDKTVEPAQGVKLLIVTITMSHEQSYREVHRRTWMSRPGVCKVNSSTVDEPAGRCRVFVAFVVGQVGGDGVIDAHIDKEAAAEGDIFRVNATDPQPLGVPVELVRSPKKTFKNEDLKRRHVEKDLTLLQYLIAHWAWVTHVGKNDLDNYPQVDLILRDINDPEGRKLGGRKGEPPVGWDNQSRPIYYGSVMGADPWDLFPRAGFMQGQFYIISRKVLVCVISKMTSRPMDYLFIDHKSRNKPQCWWEREGDMALGHRRL